MNISVVIPSYEGAELLSENLPKVFKELEEYKLGKTEVIVVDDGSSDNSAQLIKEFPKAKLIQNEKNSGFSVTVNKGVKHASGEIILLLNTDVSPEPGFLNNLISDFKDKNVFAVGCMDKSIEKDQIRLLGRGVGKWERGFLVHGRGEVDKNTTLWVSGGSGAFRRSVWESLGGLNEIYSPFYWEDIDLSYRARKSGFKVMFENKSIVVHEHEKGSIRKKFSEFQIKTTAYRNQIIFVWTNVTDADLLISHFFWLPYHFVKTLLKGDVAFTLGFLKALTLFPKVLTTRNRNKKQFVLSDKSAIIL